MNLETASLMLDLLGENEDVAMESLLQMGEESDSESAVDNVENKNLQPHSEDEEEIGVTVKAKKKISTIIDSDSEEETIAEKQASSPSLPLNESKEPETLKPEILSLIGSDTDEVENQPEQSKTNTNLLTGVIYFH